jgi:integrase
MASILKRKDSYFIMVSVGYDSDGKQIRKTMNWRPEEGMTEKQIEKAVNEQAVLFEKKVLSGQVLDENVTFDEFTKRWLTDYAEVNLAPKTLERYKSMLERILPAIGHIRLGKLQAHHLIELYKDMGNDINRRGISYLATDDCKEYLKQTGLSKDYISRMSGVHVNTIYNIFRGVPVAGETVEKVCKALGFDFEVEFEPSRPLTGLSNKTIKHHHGLISSILNQAVYWQVIVSNPASRVRPPRVERKEAKYLDEKQTLKLLELLEGKTPLHKTMIKMFIYSGLRRGELCALEWKDIDFANNLITVRRTSQYLPGKGIFTKETKTENSDRTIKLPLQTFEMLKEYAKVQKEDQLRAGDQWVKSDRIFTQWNGGPIHPDSITGWFKDFIQKTDLPQISIHSLRHTNITLLIAAGVPLRTVSYRAGHAQTSTTANIYSHAIRTADEIAADVLEDILKPKIIDNSNKVG